ncbi:hypothetical protein FPZ12_024030 [Amycolatopsis acidicola]|uniref:Uncharacterized protein n=1 Tax=Amycolatopsis acidicola TaxID=2596893 RepID=A0A5N0UXT4_9PSEU|nr:hypothetical protein [Amycolatopsis acidicola]KAA9157955.1 hypothetical protein FPZ12_024030 [Amycolatopsis acidicola]
MNLSVPDHPPPRSTPAGRRITLSVPAGVDERTAADLRAAEELTNNPPEQGRELFLRALAGLAGTGATSGEGCGG